MPTDIIRIMAYRHSAFYSPLLATIAAGFLKDEGLDSTYAPKPRDRNLYDMFRAGELDVMQAAVSTSWDPLSRGAREIPVHFAQINQKDGFFLVGRPTKRPFEWKHLEGSRLLADHAQQPLAMLKYGLHLAGVDWSRIQMVNRGGPEEMERAFRSGEGDYVHLQGPSPQQLEEDGVGQVAAALGEVIPKVAFSSLMAMRSFLATDQAKAFLRAYWRALKWVREASPEVVAQAEIRFFPGVSLEALRASIARYQSLGCWPEHPAIPRELYEVAMDVFLDGGVFQRRYRYEDVVIDLWRDLP